MIENSLRNYVVAGTKAELEKEGWIRSKVLGNDIIIISLDDEIVAMETSRAFDRENNAALPPEYHPGSSDDLNPLLNAPAIDWNTVRRYPVALKGEYILVGLNPVT